MRQGSGRGEFRSLGRLRRRRADQVVERRQSRGRACAGRHHDLLVGHGGAVAGTEHARHVGGAARVDHDLAELRALDGLAQPLGIRHQADLHEHALQLDPGIRAVAAMLEGQAVDLAASPGDLGGLGVGVDADVGQALELAHQHRVGLQLGHEFEHGDVLDHAGQVDRGLDAGVAAADHRHVLALEQGAVAARAVGHALGAVYWIFGFLRMGTSGMTSQAYGRHDLNEVTRLLLRSVGVGLFIAFTLLALQYPIERTAFTFIQTTEEVEHLASLYFYICIWGAPAVLGLYSFAGWYIGMQNSRFPMYIAITQNIVNIAVSLLLVYGLGMKIEGVAIGTLTAQYAGLVMAYLLWLRYYSTLRKRIEWHSFFDKQAMYRFFQVNRDIFFRTICLVAVTVFFTSAGAAQGEVVLAVNTLLMQLFTLFSYIMDGFAYAGEALAGRYIGANNQKALHTTVRQLFGWGVGLSLAFTLLYSIGGQSFLGLLTDETTVIHASESYFYWVLAIPLAGFSAFLFDGIFIGATATHLMLKAMIVASVSFFLIYYGFRGAMGNHALWMAFITYLLLRGVMQGVMGRNILGYKTSKKD